MRAIDCLFVLFACSLIVGPAVADDFEVDIPSQPVGDALNQFAEQSGLQVVMYAGDAEGIETEAVQGTYEEPTEVLDTLLTSTGLEYTFINDRTVSVSTVIEDERGASDSKNLSAGPTPVLMAQNQILQSPTPNSQHSDVVEEDQDVSAGLIEEIIVTGTNIRGIAPDSSPSIVLDREEIEQSGYLSTDDFVRSIPQNFAGGTINNAPLANAGDLEGESNLTAASGINLRGLGANATLTLLNGRRLAPAGRTVSVVDVSLLPLSAIDRVEILTDGASSIYGGDAISGVVNFVIRDDYEGAETTLTYGTVTEGSMDQIRASQTFGTNWTTGNALIAYEYFKQDQLFGSEKDFSRDAADPSLLIPGQERHSVIGYVSEALSDGIELDLTGLYSERDTEQLFTDVFGEIQNRQLKAEQHLVATSLTIDLPKDWQVAAAVDHSQNTGSRFITVTNETKHSQYSTDIVADGRFMAMPGGEARAAVGAAFRSENFEFRGGSGTVASEADREVWAAFGEVFLPLVGSSNRRPWLERLELNASVRFDDYSDFGSTTNPKIGMLWAPLDDLVLRASYSTSFNPPALGILGDPTFNAFIVPGTNPETGALDVPFQILQTGFATEILDAEDSNTITMGFDYNSEIGGGNLHTNFTYYDISFENSISLIPFPDGMTSTIDLPLFVDSFPAELFNFDPTAEDVQAVFELAESVGGLTGDFYEFFTGMPIPGGYDGLDFIFDFRNQNIAATETSGLDVAVEYSKEFNYGIVSASLAGTYVLDFTEKLTKTSPQVDGINRIFRPVDLRARGSLGWSRDRWSAVAFVNYVDGYPDVRFDPVRSVDSWTTLDINLSYRFIEGDRSVPENFAVALSIQNLFDEDPPRVEPSSPEFTPTFFDPANARPLGRFVSLTLTIGF